MSAVIDDHGHADHAHGPAKGLMRWVLTTNHKDIGTLYLWFAFSMFLLGGSFAMVIRAELFQPGLQIVEPAFFNQMTTNHALIMIFGAVMPAFVGLANWMIPMQIGAPDAFAIFGAQVLSSSRSTETPADGSPLAVTASGSGALTAAPPPRGCDRPVRRIRCRPGPGCWSPADCAAARPRHPEAR